MPSPGTKWSDRRPSCARPGGISALRSTGSARVDSWNAGEPWSDCFADDGVTYRRLASPVEQPWDLDPIPLVLEAAQWTTLEPGLVQRAELLDLILTDLYGPRLAARAQAPATRSRVRPRRLPPRSRPDPPPGPTAAVLVRVRSGARRRRAVDGAVRPHPSSVRGRLRDGEPPGGVADDGRNTPRPPRSAASARSSTPCDCRYNSQRRPRTKYRASCCSHPVPGARRHSIRRTCRPSWDSRSSKAPT